MFSFLFISEFHHVFPLARKINQASSAPKRLCRSRTIGLWADNRKSTWLWLELLEDRTLLTTYQWTGLGASGNWTNSANWSPSSAFPNAVGDVAQFVGPITGITSVILNQAITVGEIDFGSATGITITSTSSNVLTLSKGSGTNSVLSLLAANAAATDAISAPIAVTATSPLAATIAGGTLTLSNTGTSPANSIASGS